MELNLHVRQVERVSIVDVEGELELHNTPRLRTQLHAVCDTEQPRVVVDLSGVTFIDSSGIGVLVGALKRAREHGGTLVLVCPQPRVRRVFEITGLLKAMQLFESLDEAISAASASPDTAE